MIPGRDAASYVLVVEDTPSVAQLCAAYLKRDGHEVQIAPNGTEALAAIRAKTPSAVVLDLHLPDLSGQSILEEVNNQELPTSIVVITTDGSIRVAVDAMRAGAYDFIVKPFRAERLITTVRNALERSRLKTEVETLKDSLGRDQFCGFVGASSGMRAVYRTIEAAARSTAPVFVTGESGTGKELAAEAVHELSARQGKPFVPLNCSAIPRDLVESEIFGHVRGAFTGALADRPGAAKLAHGGTLFLDEVCEMPIELQSKLLRVLQTGTFQPVGSGKLQRADIRLVCATNRDPLAEVMAGRFREDLFYRLHVVPIHLPPLRERRDDAVLIARKLLARYSAEEGKRFLGFSGDAEAAIRAHDWPGNVRQLQNVLRNAVVMSDGEALTAAMLNIPSVRAPATVAEEAARPIQRTPPIGTEPGAYPGAAAVAAPTDPGAWAKEQDVVPLWRVEKAAIERAISVCGGNVPRAAAFLEVSPSTLYRKRQAWDGEDGT
jgi:two-component system, repressor protein LuxO